MLAGHWKTSLLLDRRFVRWENSGGEGKGFRALTWKIKEEKCQKFWMLVKSLNVLRCVSLFNDLISQIS